MLNEKYIYAYSSWIDNEDIAQKWVNIFLNRMNISGNGKLELDYATKTYLKRVASLDTSKSAAKSDLAGLKAEVD